ncbi:MAG: hypothetical protein R3B47_08710 [Bacteroidia bacterium]
MKTVLKSLLALSLLALFFSSCKNDCVAPALSENILGTWSVSTESGSEVEFKSGGELVDANGVLIDGESNGVPFSEKSYATNADSSTISFFAYTPDSTGGVEYTVNVTQNECDKVVFELIGIPVTLKRK